MILFVVALALSHLEPLGLDAERANRLEALFRAELELLAGAPLPSGAAIDAALAADPTLRACTGQPECLAALGRRLGAARIISGNVGALGDSFVVNLKLVDVGRRVELRRVSERLSGSPDQLIEAVRVAAYRLVAPEALRGSLAVLSDVAGASVLVDGQPAGRTPLEGPLDGIAVGTHQVRVEAEGFAPFASPVDVRFQKTSELVVRMGGPGRPAPEAPHARPSPWVYVAVGAGAVLVGALIGRALASESVVDCTHGGCR
jgi:hypothetical protein